MSWLPAMMFMHALDDDEFDQFTQVDKSDDTHTVVTKIYPPVTDGTPANNNNNDGNAPAAANNTQPTPTITTRTWHHTAMSAATFTLSALLGYIATETIFKRIRGRN